MGVPFLPAARRKERLAEFVEIVRALLDGATVDHHGVHFELAGASTGRATPARRVPMLVGGSGTNLLAHAGRHADIVGFTGLGRTLPDGHRHTVRFQPEVLDTEVALVRAAAAGRDVELNVLVQVVDVTDDREAAAAGLAGADRRPHGRRRPGDAVPGSRHPRRDRRAPAPGDGPLGHRLLRRARRRAVRARSSTACADAGRATRTPPDPAGSGDVASTSLSQLVGGHRVSVSPVVTTGIGDVPTDHGVRRGVVIVVVIAASGEGGDRQRCGGDHGQWLPAHRH